MKAQSVDRRVRRAVSPIESLEGRLLLSATMVSQVPAQIVFAGQAGSVNLSTYFNDPTVTGTAVEIQTPEGNIPISLTDSKTPKTVANFLQYINSGEYNNVIIHRLALNFVIQGGGFQADGTENPTFAPVPSEAGISNTTGTIAMALTTGPNTGTDQWYINLANNTGLDTSGPSSGNSGPFTVFGNVIYNGMSVAAAINGLQIVDDSTQNGAFNTLPVLPTYTGPNPATSVPAADMLVTSTVVVPALSYSVSVADPTLFSATVSNGTMSLTPLAGQTSGSTTVTVTATDLGGGTATSTFNVSLTNGTSDAVVIGTGAAKSVTYTDTDGTTATLALKGPGTATVNFAGSGLVTKTQKNGSAIVTSTTASIAGIVTTGTTSQSALSITTKGGTKAISIGDITTDGLKSLTGKGVTLAGNITSASSIGTLGVAGATGGSFDLASIGTFAATSSVSANITLSGAGTSLGKFTAGSITGGTWLISGNAKSITAGMVSNWSPDFTGSIATMSVTKGDLSGTITAASIGNLHVKSGLNAATIQLTGTGKDLTSLSVGGAILNSTIDSAGGLGNISAASLNTSNIYAGIAMLASGQVLPNFPSDFATNQSIASVRLRTVRNGDSFFNANIAAQSIGTLSLGTILTNNGGITTGVASEGIKSFTAIFAPKHVSLKNVTSTNEMTELAKTNPELGDFVLKLF